MQRIPRYLRTKRIADYDLFRAHIESRATTRSTQPFLPATFSPPSPQTLLPTNFTPPNPQATPTTLFEPRHFFLRDLPPIRRFVNRTDPSQCLVFTDGACIHHHRDKNNTKPPKAGWSFIFKPPHSTTKNGYFSARLETRGPEGETYPQTSNRAELRAVIAALRFIYYNDNVFDSVVVATDSKYVVHGATDWIQRWGSNGWRSVNGTPIKNQDLWQALLKEVGRWDADGKGVCFWWIRREWNVKADCLAKRAAREGAEVREWVDVGMPIWPIVEG
ncbi:ribonuclease H-like protein [Aspergillus heteromorphus CBS 117.55]|uniref:ribonuclease H n=1 Tax=Aspergillus heteromorphus CBS 117.55 TaxID=1448321 RepID=A0A317WL76_9EURO|nr:ribonuclease H-like protein [Aspergillus heteromorphus CBS 117.55]PWY86072.1 ribonuclease H-like protein [Aspergillus heteromorphus CBS 117.55]